MKRRFDMMANTLTQRLLPIVILAGMFATPAVGQIPDGHHHPLSQHSPPGKAAGWLNAIRHYDPTWLQPLLIEVPGGGQVEVFSGSSQAMGAANAPALVAVNAGHLYRFRISNMPDLPGVEFYPSVELLDHLHPPAGRDNEFPIPIILTKEDIRSALSGTLVTRVIYLEQPQLAQTLDPLRREIPQSVSPSTNALQEADKLGRPMAIIRVGGRRPSRNTPPVFYGTGGAFQMRQFAVNNSRTAGGVRSHQSAGIQQISGTSAP